MYWYLVAIALLVTLVLVGNRANGVGESLSEKLNRGGNTPRQECRMGVQLARANRTAGWTFASALFLVLAIAGGIH